MGSQVNQTSGNARQCPAIVFAGQDSTQPSPPLSRDWQIVTVVKRSQIISKAHLMTSSTRHE
jgi:hypothetical protein